MHVSRVCKSIFFQLQRISDYLSVSKKSWKMMILSISYFSTDLLFNYCLSSVLPISFPTLSSSFSPLLSPCFLSSFLSHPLLSSRLPSNLFHAAQLVHCSLVVLHTVLSQLQVSGVLKNTQHTGSAYTPTHTQDGTHTHRNTHTHLAELLLVLRHLLQHLGQIPHCGLLKQTQAIKVWQTIMMDF